MSFGPIASFVVGTSDVSAPGEPIFGAFVQTDNFLALLDVQCPGADVGGGSLTGLRHLNLVTIAGNDPLAGQSPDEIIAAGVGVQQVPLTDEDAGIVKTLSVPVLNAGQVQTFYCWADDDN